MIIDPRLFEIFINNKTTLDIAYSFNHAAATSDISSSVEPFRLYFNHDPDEIEELGRYEFWTNGEKVASHMERSFVDPLQPTPDELLLFEIEHGQPYTLLDYMKEGT